MLLAAHSLLLRRLSNGCDSGEVVSSTRRSVRFRSAAWLSQDIATAEILPLVSQSLFYRRISGYAINRG
jgi:hypothetical protein